MRGPSTAGLLAALVVVLVGWALDRAETERYCSETRADIRDRLSSARAHIEGLLNRRLYLVRALQAYVVNNPEIDQDEFAKFAEILIAEDQSIRSMTSTLSRRPMRRPQDATAVPVWAWQSRHAWFN